MRDRMLGNIQDSGLRGEDDFGARGPEHRERNNARPPPNRGASRDEDDDLRRALQASMDSEAEENRRRSQRRDEDDDLAKAIRLSEEEEQKRKREAEEANKNALMDDSFQLESNNQYQQQQMGMMNTGFPLVDTSFGQQPLQPQFTSYNVSDYPYIALTSALLRSDACPAAATERAAAARVHAPTAIATDDATAATATAAGRVHEATDVPATAAAAKSPTTAHVCRVQQPLCTTPTWIIAGPANRHAEQWLPAVVFLACTADTDSAIVSIPKHHADSIVSGQASLDTTSTEEGRRGARRSGWPSRSWARRRSRHFRKPGQSPYPCWPAVPRLQPPCYTADWQLWRQQPLRTSGAEPEPATEPAAATEQRSAVLLDIGVRVM